MDKHAVVAFGAFPVELEPVEVEFLALGAAEIAVGCSDCGIGPWAVGPVLGIVVFAGGSAAVEGVVLIVWDRAVAGWRVGGGGHCGERGNGKG